MAASYRTRNFIVSAPDAGLAKAVGDAAERYRLELAQHWLGRQLPPWRGPCPIRVVAGHHLAAQGVTTYNRRPVRDFQMEVVGTPQRILDSVLPHEVTHTILASHFGRPLPRWADEGICTTVEHESEKYKHELKLREFLASRRGIAMNKLFLLTEYPNDILPMYAQGYSVCRFLIEQKSPRQFVDFLTDYMQTPSWTLNIKKHYGYESLSELQEHWLAWVGEGSGPVDRFVKNADLSAPTRPAVGTVALASGSSRELGLNAPMRSESQAGYTVSQSRSTQSRSSQPLNIQPRPAPSPRGIAASQPAGRTPASRDASSGTAGWYSRQREQTAQSTGNRAIDQIGVATMAPPSVRNANHYQAASPQPEYGVRR